MNNFDFEALLRSAQQPKDTDKAIEDFLSGFKDKDAAQRWMREKYPGLFVFERK